MRRELHDQVRVLKDESRGRAFLPAVIKETNANTKALGFLPTAAYEEALVAGRLWILVVNGAYSGHLAFGGSLPTLHVIQLFVLGHMRGQGLARLLVEQLVDYGEVQGYTSIRARVASDLDANGVWERLGFEVVSVVAGGQTTGRQINRRFRRLTPRSPQTHMFAILDGVFNASALVAHGMPINRVHWYTLDINVWLDFARKRQPFFDAARSLIEDASRGRFRIRFTREAIDEAKRSSGGRDFDPLMDVVQTWQTVPEEDCEELTALTAQLRAIIFPERSESGRRSANDASDLRHLAMSIRAGATGFVTREKALLRHRSLIFQSYGLDVVSPIDLIEYDEPSSFPLMPLREGLRIESIQRRWPDAVAKIKASTAQGSRLRALDREDEGRVCLLSDRLVGLLYWRQSHRSDVEAYLVLDPADGIPADMHQRVLDVLLGVLVAEARSSHRFHRILLRADPNTSALTGSYRS